MVAGIPAKVIGYVAEQDPSLTMKHGMVRFSFSWKKAFDILSFYVLTAAIRHADATKEFFEHIAGSSCCRDAKGIG